MVKSFESMSFRLHKNDTKPKLSKTITIITECFRLHKNDTKPKHLAAAWHNCHGFRLHKNDTKPKPQIIKKLTKNVKFLGYLTKNLRILGYFYCLIRY